MIIFEFERQTGTLTINDVLNALCLRFEYLNLKMKGKNDYAKKERENHRFIRGREMEIEAHRSIILSKYLNSVGKIDGPTKRAYI